MLRTKEIGAVAPEGTMSQGTFIAGGEGLGNGEGA
jgi:hypothetical protein